MKKLFILFIILAFPFMVSAEMACPIGEVNDPFPGQCASYIDQNYDNLCDLSQVEDSEGHTATLTEEALKQLTVKEVAEQYGISTSEYIRVLSGYLKITVKETDSLQILHDNNGLCSGVAANLAVKIANDTSNESGLETEIDTHDLISGEEVKEKKVYEIAEIYDINQQAFANAISEEIKVSVKLTESFLNLHDNYGLAPSRVKEIAESLMTSDPVTIQTQTQEQAQTTLVKTETKGARYGFANITLVLFVLYLATYILKEKKKITLLNFRRIWNVVLLISFLLVGLSGVLLIIRINWGFYIALPFNILHWHVETGTVMFWSALFHVSWYWRFYAVMFRKKKD